MSTTTQIKTLKRHAAQMRTRYDPDGMAALTLQVFQRGLDTWQPIVAAPAGENGDYHIISGHRRRMAQLFAFALVEWAEDHPDREATIEVARTLITTLAEELGSVAEAAEALLQKYGEREIPFVPFAGDRKTQVLALQAANFGREEADALGIAHSFRQALESGATPAEIARNAGHSVPYVRNHLALADLPAELAERIAAGDLPLSVAGTVADLAEPKRTGLALFLLANAPGALTAKEIRTCARTLKGWPGLHLPLTFPPHTTAATRNIARALARLWGQVAEAYPDDAYAAAAMLIHRGLHDDPWATAEKAALWFQALGGDVYSGPAGIRWAAVVEHLVPEVACATCPIADLPARQLRCDLSGGQGGVLGMPCRTGEEATRCIHGLAPDDPVDVRVPWEWSEHEGVVHAGGHYRVTSADALLAAWEAQAAVEREEQGAGESTVASGEGQVASKSTVAGGASQVESDRAEERPAPATRNSPPVTPSPIETQRARIRAFMDSHGDMALTHPFATGCAGCRHHLDRSPTKDETVPHCAWAGRRRKVTFKTLRPAGANGQAAVARPIPVCRQYAPVAAWHELVPAHPAPPGLPRDWVQAQLLLLVAAGQPGYGRGYHPFEFLTGRPMKSDEQYGDWFAQQLDEQSGHLSDAQLWTLFVWATAEWQRAQGKAFLLPTNGSGAQFAAYETAPWPAPAGAKEDAS